MRRGFPGWLDGWGRRGGGAYVRYHVWPIVLSAPGGCNEYVLLHTVGMAASLRTLAILCGKVWIQQGLPSWDELRAAGNRSPLLVPGRRKWLEHWLRACEIKWARRARLRTLFRPSNSPMRDGHYPLNKDESKHSHLQNGLPARIQLRSAWRRSFTMPELVG